jgi:hypothetical protein
MPNQKITFDKGLVTNRDPSSLTEGELQQAVGCEYRIGTSHIYKQPGRKAVAQANISHSINAIHKFQYDVQADKLIAYASDGDIHEATVSTSSVFGAAVLTGLTNAVPQFSSFSNSWIMCNGTDANYIREPQAVPVSGWSTGNWRKLGMRAPSTPLTISFSAGAGDEVNPDAGSGNWADEGNVIDESSISTFATGTANTGDPSQTTIWTFGSDAALDTGNGRYVKVRHAGVIDESIVGYRTPLSLFPVPGGITARIKIEVSEDGGSGWTEISNQLAPYTTRTSSFLLASGTDLDTQVQVKTSITALAIYNTLAWAQARVSNIKVVKDGGSDANTTTNTIFYALSERYEDSDGVIHNSPIGPMLELTPTEVGTAYGATLTLPGSTVNDFTTSFVIWRTLDSAGQGYPFFYEIDAIPSSETTFLDDFSLSLTLADDKEGKLYEVLNVLYPDGSTIAFPLHTPPPDSKMSLMFQGSMVYVPQAPKFKRRIYYSIPVSISAAAAEQVPEIYYIEFQTERNDVVNCIARTNSGRTLLAFFDTYTMLVNYLPQATDPGVFDNRVLEYVSTTRGAAGKHSAIEIDVGAGRTVAVAVDSLGVWATDGITEVQEWSRDIDWDTVMAGVTFSNIQLYNNFEMRRVEMLYVDSSSNHQEYHFYYGRAKEAHDGGRTLLVTGPHPASRSTGTIGYQCKHYFQLGAGTWAGLSGTVADGTVKTFIERKDASGDAYYTDDALAYDASGNVPFQVKTADFRFAGLGSAFIVDFGYPEWRTSDGAKTLAGTATSGFTGTFVRDSGSTSTVTKGFVIGTNKKIYWHRYADYCNFAVNDVSTTLMPALVEYEVELREGGIGREK